jgi:DNA-binding transcriptional regulator YiaG
MTPEELTNRREELGLTQSELARMLGVPRAYVWRWEDGRYKVPPLMDMALRGVEATLNLQPRRRRRRRVNKLPSPSE